MLCDVIFLVRLHGPWPFKTPSELTPPCLVLQIALHQSSLTCSHLSLSLSSFHLELVRISSNVKLNSKQIHAEEFWTLLSCGPRTYPPLV